MSLDGFGMTSGPRWAIVSADGGAAVFPASVDFEGARRALDTRRESNPDFYAGALLVRARLEIDTLEGKSA